MHHHASKRRWHIRFDEAEELEDNFYLHVAVCLFTLRSEKFPIALRMHGWWGVCTIARGLAQALNIGEVGDVADWVLLIEDFTEIVKAMAFVRMGKDLGGIDLEQQVVLVFVTTSQSDCSQESCIGSVCDTSR